MFWRGGVVAWEPDCNLHQQTMQFDALMNICFVSRTASLIILIALTA